MTPTKIERLKQAWCALRGHLDGQMMQMDADRIWLRCGHCQHETPGWELTATPPAVRWRRFLRFQKRLASS